MLRRYTKQEMADVWSELRKKGNWHLVESAVLAAREKLGQIPSGTATKVSALVVTEEIMKRADEIEAVNDHDLLAFVLAVTEQLPEEVKPFYHDGLTSFDDEDTGLGLLMVESLNIIIKSLGRLREVLLRRINEQRGTLMVGRTHGIHAKPITFGLKLLNWLQVIEFHMTNLESVKSTVGIGKLSGAVGTFTLDPEVEVLACRELGLSEAAISTQIISRHIHVQYAMALVAVGNSLDKFATDIRLMASTDVSEVAEFKRPGASGSSAMPGKSRLRNPIKSENVCSLAKVVRGYIIPALECEVLWHERTLDNSAAERVYIPDLTIAVHFMIERFCDTIDKLEVYPQQMLVNLNRTGGIIFAEAVMMALTKTAMPRPEAYQLCELLALQVNPGSFVDYRGKTFRDIVYEDVVITERVSIEQLDRCFDPTNSLKNIDQVFARFGL